MGTGEARVPRVKVIVLNFNGWPHVADCLRHLDAVDWPKSHLDVLVIDNGSTDGSAERIADLFPTVRLERLPANVGYAAGNNVGLRERDDCDYVALLNNDAFVRRDWLRPLVAAVESDHRVGAATSKVLLAPQFIEVDVPASGESFCITGVEVDGDDVTARARFPGGRCADDRAAVWLPVALDADEPLTARVLVSTSRTAPCRGSRDPFWVEVETTAARFDVINNAGNIVYADGYGADRGLGERDAGQYDSPAEVFAWCGCSVLLARAYLDDVGVFDEDLFAYYEDIDLSWRGRKAGWRYVYVPSSVARHLHTATSVEGTAFFDHHVERNRLIVMTRNGPPAFAARVVWRTLRTIAALLFSDVVVPAVRLRKPDVRPVLRRAAAFGSFVVRVPRIIAQRRRLSRPERFADDEVLTWLVSP